MYCNVVPSYLRHMPRPIYIIAYVYCNSATSNLQTLTPKCCRLLANRSASSLTFCYSRISCLCVSQWGMSVIFLYLAALLWVYVGAGSPVEDNTWCENNITWFSVGILLSCVRHLSKYHGHQLDAVADFGLFHRRTCAC